MKSRVVWIVLALILLLCLVGLVVGFVLIQVRTAQAADLPLVIINAPSSGSEVSLDRLSPVLVTVRSPSGVDRVELWANGQLQENRPAPQQGLNTFNTAFAWQPARSGAYTLIARAFDSRGNAGQASVAVRVVEEVPENEPPVPPPSDEEEEIVPPEHGDEPGDPPPAGGEGEPPEEGEGEPEAPPEGEEPPEAEEPPAEEPPAEEPPAEPEAPPEGEPPAPDPEGPADESVEVGPEVGPVMLTLEAVAVDEASTDYHNLNCYFTVAEAETEQVVFEYGLGDYPWRPTQGISATFPWDAEEPLPVRVECTGIAPPAAGVPLGTPAEDEVAPELWDGRNLHLASAGAYDFVYRVYLATGATSEEIVAPTNLRIEDVPFSPLKMLRWDWAGDETTIAGFRMYLNGSLQWKVADPSARFTYLPPEWVEPPCGQFFLFQVTAYQGPFPGGVESLPGEMAPLEPEAGRCGGIYRVTFLGMGMASLDYPVDLPAVADADGKAGPLYGWMAAGNDLMPFDTVQTDGIGVSGVRVEGGSVMPLSATLYGAPYRYHRHSSVFQWDNEESNLTLSIMLVDYDWSETDLEDDVMCFGTEVLPGPPPAPHLGVLDCRKPFFGPDVAHVLYTIQELPEWPEGEPPPGAVPGAPRPDLSISWWRVLPTGEVEIRVSNDGQAAAVPDVDLTVERDGVEVGNYTVPAGDDALNGEWNGWASFYTLPDLTVTGLPDVCDLSVTVDPANAYLEYDETNNTTTAADLETAWGPGVTRTSPTEATMNVIVAYYTCHGDTVGVRVVPLAGGADAAGFDFSPDSVPVPHGQTNMSFDVAYTGGSPLTTDGWRVEMVDLDTSEVFFSQTFEEEQDWTP